MLKSLKIENFRRFKSFELEDLGRINLLVGMNNSGKTSILEAIQLLCSRTYIDILRQSTIERGEFSIVDNYGGKVEDTLLNIADLFFGHEIDLDTKCTIAGNNSNLDEERVILSVSKNEAIAEYKLIFKIEWVSQKETKSWHTSLFPSGEISDREIAINSSEHDIIRKWETRKDETLKAQLVSLSSLTGEEMKNLFDSISLMPEESLIYDSLQKIEPKLKRIATVSKTSKKLSDREGFFVRLSDSDRRIPLGSLGDGIWRMLGLTLALLNAKGGILLVDEIDTGLHFTALSDMWKFIWKVAKELDVQVFATTHNSDCWQSLASIASLEETEQDGITIQRIEKDKQKAVVFPREGIVIAAEDDIEVR
ncbi:AAA family ATPase [Spirulina sp. 06S082]|uniref:AAA family ATPase n=1 Tax=Spirulina sp. 06S082 TaxID=3110248 RepID=UPI002B21FCCA|nr:AAA family ATPase [Spirulina sp. 06S082]MEA5470331.1 AAA family ATPase [Spirulina sp. 06S082]